ncbi:MAG: beta-ketoacyl-[acyl-carrier-protein] synthase family protein [Flavobacteriales bacterium CG_4_10_14_0_2_um_filter_32_8]|nr:MAG: beta-ketoacyl-[acyl-carrier-protein] synthase family protein [Flavobacteriales bacterium CG_4_10_14_0_2_um_filter_32_8]PJB15220.1 MAG: beta-ketoacyl-[acyl-carrier-protein] synthase family protein [Flavobacteriales bacterium CG_4_9_14_3_um_filter_32_8]
MKHVFVTGIGVISAIGNNCEENLSHLQKGKTGIGKAIHLDSNYAKLFPFGEVKLSTSALKSNLNIAQKGLTRTDLLAFTAVQEAIQKANLTAQEISSENTAFISASTIGGMCLTDQLYQDANSISKSKEYVKSYSVSAHALKIAENYQLKGTIDVINTACSSSLNAIMMGTRLIKSGRATRAIVGGTDALGKFTINGFNALQILSKNPCKPFDKYRDGLTLGEGAAYLILESEEVVGKKNLYAEILGYGNSNDAFHPSSLSEEAFGVVAAMNKALKRATLSPQKINYINTHGTATENNDTTELTGIKKIFGNYPAFNSTKSYTGHTLAASGAIETVFSIFSLQQQELYPSLNFETPISPFNQLPILKYQQHQNINYVMTNSFGFAGNCSSLIIGKPL